MNLTEKTDQSVTPPKFPAHVAARIAATYGPYRPALTAVAAGWGICGCGKPDTPGHKCASLSPAGEDALGRGLAVVDEVQRQREQTIREQTDASYAEYADQPFVEYYDWARTAA